jgi:formate dehydrogenase subunit beta
MGQYAAIATGGELRKTVSGLLRQLLEKKVARAVMVAAAQPHQKMIMPTLVSDPEMLEAADPFAPVAPRSAATVLGGLTRTPGGAPLAAVLRSCEVRAFIELCKLHQGSMKELLLIGVDCLGRYENGDYRRLAATHDDLTLAFLKSASGPSQGALDGAELTAACRSCEHPVAEAVDLRLCVIGSDPLVEVGLEAASEAGRRVLAELGLEAGNPPAGREAALAELVARRRAFREEHLAEFAEKVQNIEELAALVAPCVNCYNCRVACPVCYCRECVFATDTFRHDGDQYLRWALGRGRLKLPADTVFYHLTRMMHMTTLCVGCGQCTSACPNEIPVMELFQSVAARTQARFGYVPGRSIEEPQPLAVFKAEEYDDVTGQVK